MHDKKMAYFTAHPDLAVNEETYAKLDAIKLDVLKRVFKAELLS